MAVEMLSKIKIFTALVALFCFISVASAKPLISSSSSPHTPYATLLNCSSSKSETGYKLWTLQSSSAKSDTLQQRFETQVYQKKAAKDRSWKTINESEWRGIKRSARNVISTTEVKVQNADGKRFRELVHFRWRFKSKGKLKSKETTRVTRALKRPVKGRASCKF